MSIPGLVFLQVVSSVCECIYFTSHTERWSVHLDVTHILVLAGGTNTLCSAVFTKFNRQIGKMGTKPKMRT